MKRKEKIFVILFTILGLSLLISSVFWKEVVSVLPFLAGVSEVFPMIVGGLLLMTCGIVALHCHEEKEIFD
ncbi:hypothetical protein HN858_05855 [Candidatus Falkowbacteria bacterium]|jgi:hypothetical protein|nr:hypothetical protein [Candidatus Falkowbacteria bacterium]MBT5503312.1 hypothetical protein [Candidatus Falkowbacteria bacterium]MBT6573644.1 hypothetical protein [Candidatus Falkowbacteria bacterium]MBT7349162.1 hypothetical protein [Candidatus Falkowbacteria bacterium]MBT7500115.1 hypothetical protein [Candidatus Falkowbacteria bacterium]